MERVRLNRALNKETKYYGLTSIQDKDIVNM